MIFYPVPNSFPCNKGELAALAKVCYTPFNLSQFASSELIGGVMPSEGAGTKPWRDNGIIYSNKLFGTYLFLDGEVNLKLRPAPGDAGNTIVDAEGLMQLNGFYSGPVIKFYNERFLLSGGTEFARIPRLVLQTVDASEAKRLNITGTLKSASNIYPIGMAVDDPYVKNTLNPKIAFRFVPGSDNKIEAFNIDDYDREFPIKTSKYTDEEFLNNIRFILGSQNLSDSAKVAAIRDFSK